MEQLDMIARAIRWEEDVFNLVFDRDAIIRAALRAYTETHLAWADPLERLRPVSSEVMWTGDLRRGAFYNGNGCGDYDVVAWTEAGVVGLGFAMGFGPLQLLGLSREAVTGGPDDVRGAVPGLPAEMEPTFQMAVGMLEGTGPDGEKLAGVGFWLHGDRVGGNLFDETLFEDPELCGALRLVAWGSLRGGRLPYMYDAQDTAAISAENVRRGAAPVEAIVDAVTDRALAGPTTLIAKEIATLLPSPPQPERLRDAQKGLRQVGIAWPGMPETPPEPPAGSAD